MTPLETKNLPGSIHARLLNQARATGRPMNEVLQYYGMERFLYRLSKSAYSGRFVLKGALMFLIWGAPVYRPTKDIDLLCYSGNAVDHIIQMMKEICSQPVEPDGLGFEPESVQGEKIKEDADYEGVRIRLIAMLGKARIPVQIDLGFADVIFPGPVAVEYPTLLPMPAARLRGYPKETVIAEKLQAMIYLGNANSRMKDFYDIWALSRQFDFSSRTLNQAILETFQNRGTSIPFELPSALTESFAGEKQAQWVSFLERTRLSETPKDFRSIVQNLQDFLWLPLQMVRQGNISGRYWSAGGPWRTAG